MTDTTPHRATPELPPPEPTVWSAINALADRLAAAEQRISELQTCHNTAADQELEACSSVLENQLCCFVTEDLRAIRRPKPRA